MTSCVVKWCKKRKEGSKKQTGITYHSFPKKEIRRMQWIAAVRLERREDDWLPTNASRVCSIHFASEDMYSSRTGYRILNKSAVPVCTMVRNDSWHLQRQNISKMSSLVQESAERQKLTMQSKEELPIAAIAASNGNINKSHIDRTHIKKISSNLHARWQRQIEKLRANNLISHTTHLDGNPATWESHTSSEIYAAIKQTGKCTQAIDYLDDGNSLPIKRMEIQHNIETVHEYETEKARALCDTPINIPSSDSDSESVFNTPRIQYLKQQLRNKILLDEKRLIKIKNLQRANKRLL